MAVMTIENLEAEMMKLDSKERARLAGRLLESLDTLSPEENARLWAEEAEARSAALDAGLLASRPADVAIREARSKL